MANTAPVVRRNDSSKGVKLPNDAIQPSESTGLLEMTETTGSTEDVLHRLHRTLVYGSYSDYQQLE
jgi:hypothetical protein